MHIAQSMRVLQEDAISLLLLTPSINDRSKLKGQCTDVKSGCGTSVDLVKTPKVSVLKKISCYCPFQIVLINFGIQFKKMYIQNIFCVEVCIDNL